MFDAFLQSIWCSSFGMTEKGSRCKSGAIPVAVSFRPMMAFALQTTDEFRWEGAQKQARRPADGYFKPGLSGEKPEGSKPAASANGFFFSVPVRNVLYMYLKIFGFIIAANFCMNIFAQETSRSVSTILEKDSIQSMDEIVVTANRFPQKQNQTGKVLTVITKEMLEKNSGRSTAEILNQFAGLNLVGANNTPGTNIEIYTRGANVGNTLILIDGIPIFDVSSITTAFDINHFTADQLERIEILKGGQSTVYGSDAVAGVINFITRKSVNKPLQSNLSFSTGSFGIMNASAGVSANYKRNQIYIQYQRFQSKGLSSAIDTTSGSGYDKDGFQQNILNLSYQYIFNSKLTWNINTQYSNYHADIDANAFQDDKDNKVYSKNNLISTGFTYKKENAIWHLNYSMNQTNRRYDDDSSSIGGYFKYSLSDYEGISHFAELFGKFTLHKNWNIVTGIDSRLQRTDQHFLFIDDWGTYEGGLKKDTSKINMYSIYTSVLYHSGKGFQMEGGLRYNDHSRYGNNVTYSLNPSYVSNKWKFFINLSSAFKAPSLYQLYDAYSGMPLLKPEKSTILEFGTQVRLLENSLTARVTGFMRTSFNGIDYSYISYRYFNNNRVWDRGVEWESSFRKGKWDLTLNYTYLTGKVNTIKYSMVGWEYVQDGDTTYNYQFRRPKHAANLNVGFKATDKWYMNFSSRVIGKRREAVYMSDPIQLDAYHVFNIYSEYAMKKTILFADLKNIFNAKYIDTYGFTTRPRNFIVGLRVRI